MLSFAKVLRLKIISMKIISMKIIGKEGGKCTLYTSVENKLFPLGGISMHSAYDKGARIFLERAAEETRKKF